MQNQIVFAYKKEKQLFVLIKKTKIFKSFRTKIKKFIQVPVFTLLRLKRIYVLEMISSVMYEHDHPIRYTILHCIEYVKRFFYSTDCVSIKANM